MRQILRSKGSRRIVLAAVGLLITLGAISAIRHEINSRRFSEQQVRTSRVADEASRILYKNIGAYGRTQKLYDVSIREIKALPEARDLWIGQLPDFGGLVISVPPEGEAAITVVGPHTSDPAFDAAHWQ